MLFIGLVQSFWLCFVVLGCTLSIVLYNVDFNERMV